MESAFGVDHGEISKGVRSYVQSWKSFGGAMKDLGHYTAHRVNQSHPVKMGRMNAAIARDKTAIKVGIPVKYAAKTAAMRTKYAALGAKDSAKYKALSVKDRLSRR